MVRTLNLANYAMSSGWQDPALFMGVNMLGRCTDGLSCNKRNQYIAAVQSAQAMIESALARINRSLYDQQAFHSTASPVVCFQPSETLSEFVTRTVTANIEYVGSDGIPRSARSAIIHADIPLAKPGEVLVGLRLEPKTNNCLRFDIRFDDWRIDEQTLFASAMAYNFVDLEALSQRHDRPSDYGNDCDSDAVVPYLNKINLLCTFKRSTTPYAVFEKLPQHCVPSSPCELVRKPVCMIEVDQDCFEFREIAERSCVCQPPQGCRQSPLHYEYTTTTLGLWSLAAEQAILSLANCLLPIEACYSCAPQLKARWEDDNGLIKREGMMYFGQNIFGFNKPGAYIAQAFVRNAGAKSALTIG